MRHVANGAVSPVGLGVIAAVDLLAGLCPLNRETPHLGMFLAIVGTLSALTTLVGIVETRFPHVNLRAWNVPAMAETVISAPCLALWMLFHMTIC